MQENAAAGALLKWPVGVREGFSARQEPRVRAGDFPGTTEHQLGDNAEAALVPGGDQRTEWLRDGQTCAASRLCVGTRRPGRNDDRDKSRSLGFSPGTNFLSPFKSSVFF